jgi:hypothetical protein
MKGLFRRKFLAILAMFFIVPKSKAKSLDDNSAKGVLKLPTNPIPFQTIHEVKVNRIEWHLPKLVIDPGTEAVFGKRGPLKFSEIARGIDNPQPVIYFQYTGPDLGWIVLC